MIRRLGLLLWAASLLTLLPGATKPMSEKDFVKALAPLIDPAKLATLGERAANPRICKAVYWLESARQTGLKPAAVADQAIAGVKMLGDAASLTREALIRNLSIADRLGCLDAAGLAELRKGQAPTIRKGPYAGQELTVDHIVPRAVCGELDKVIANLEFMPARLNFSKGSKIGDRQVDVARKLHRARLLSREGLARVEAARASRR